MTFQTFAQKGQPVSVVVNDVSSDWLKDTSTCLGLRYKRLDDLIHAKVDSISKEILWEKLGKPDRTQRFFSGTSKKNYVEYVYYICKKGCPKPLVSDISIVFVFEEAESHLVEIRVQDYSG